MKPNLTPEEQVSAAFHHLCQGVEQQIIASMFMVNIGRVNEAVQKARKAFYPPATPAPQTPPDHIMGGNNG